MNMRRLLILIPILLIGALAWPRAEAADCTSVKATAISYGKSVVIPDVGFRELFVPAIIDANRGLFDRADLYRLVDWIADHPDCFIAEEVTRARMVLDRI
jgi:hypothetical protein